MLRYLAYIVSVVATLLSLALVATGHRDWTWLLLLAGALAVIGTWDLLQKKTTLRRILPPLSAVKITLGDAVHPRRFRSPQEPKLSWA